MPRSKRQRSSTKIYHMVLRGINKQTIFEEKEDHIIFLHILQHYKVKCKFKIYGYCLMGNHIHILFKEGDEEWEITMRRIGANFVYWYNLKYDRCGHLFQDRYKSEVVENTTYLLNVLRYIHQNPLKAAMVQDIADYPWSSYQKYLQDSKLIDREFILGIFNKDSDKALSLFQDFHLQTSPDHFLDVSESKRLTDNEAIKIIKEVCHVTHAIDLQKVKQKHIRDQYLRLLKEKGLSTRQLARLTGISRGVILKVK